MGPRRHRLAALVPQLLLAVLAVPSGLASHAHAKHAAPRLSDCQACDPAPVGPVLADRDRLMAGLGPGNLTAHPLSFYVAGWISHGNIGDELVHIMLVEHFKQLLADVHGGPGKPGQHISTEFRFTMDEEKKLPKIGSNLASKTDGLILGGGSLFGSNYVSRLVSAFKGQPFFVYGTGWFGMDGNKGDFRHGLDKLVAGGPLYGGVRGPVTASYMAKHYGYSWPVVGDSAFLMGELLPSNSAYLANRLFIDHYDSRPYIVVCPPTGSDYHKTWSNTAEDQAHNKDFTDAVMLFLARLLATHRIVVVPADGDLAEQYGKEFMERLERVWARLRKEDPGFTAEATDPGTCSYAAKCERPPLQMVGHVGLPELLSLYRHADFSIASRFHPGIISLATLTPNLFICLHGVRCKSKYDDGVISVFGEKEWLVTWDSHLEKAGNMEERADVLMAEVQRLVASRVEVVGKIKDAIFKFKEAHRKALREYWDAVCATVPEKCAVLARSRFVRVTSLKMHEAGVIMIEGDG